MNQVNLPWLYQANFPASQAGKLGSVYYTVYNGTGTLHTARNKVNVVEFSGGAYGINITFSTAGSYSIHWDITNTPYVANEEIRVYDYTDITVTVPDVYTVYGT